MARWKRWALGAVLVLGALAAVPFLVPVAGFIPDVTRVASEKLGQPVRIGDLQLHMLPTPRVVASGIEIGRAGEARVGELEIVPDLLSFLSGTRTIRLVRASDVSVRGFSLGLPASKTPGSGGTVHVSRVVLLNVTVSHPSVRIPAFDLDLAMGPRFVVEHAELLSRDRAVKVRLEPEGNGTTRLSLEAKGWTLPAGAPLTFEALAARGFMKGSRVELASIEGTLYGGTLKGGASIDWTKQWQLSGTAMLDGVDLAPVQAALGKAPSLSGQLQATAAFSSRSKAVGQLAEALTLDGPFEVLGGAYQGVDLSKAGDITGRVAEGDATSFEELKGKLQVRGRKVRIEELCVRSPKVVAGGYVEIDAEKLAGKLDVSVAKTGGFVGVPVTLGGTTSEPSVRPSTGYLVGAALGTVLLPGIGTTLGASAGSKLEGVSSSCK